ncbi:protein preY, mitochondrial [Bombina bombina]|uniref:protein preY, mitochondrial n=1 Tax=Bombina bombina TaxID=8345 RepID=UPI00235B2D2B|nr:protein preY, mitochondrial [Bombina bombina]
MLGIGVCNRVCNFIAQFSVPAASVTRALPAPALRSLHTTAAVSADKEFKDSKTFDPALLQFLVCPLSRKSVRYEESTNELINDELGIAYPIVDGIPNMIPQDARMIKKDQEPVDTNPTL